MTHYNKEQITEILRNLARQLGKSSLSRKEIASVMPESTVNRRFGNLGNALEAAGLHRGDSAVHLRNRGPQIEDDDLFRALHEVERKIGCEPGFNACSAHCAYSTRPYKRFGKWPDVLAHYRKWKSENEHMLPSGVLQDTGNGDEKAVGEGSGGSAATCAPVLSVGTRKKEKPEQFYGEPINFRGLRHAPINEQGVVFLFAMVSRELGFIIESVQQGFPDCEGKYLYDRKTNHWAKARIEFEYKASNFEQHGHDPKQCDFVVCWQNDWPDCPVDVIELRAEILKLSSR